MRGTMGHVTSSKNLLSRISRIRGQIDAVERQLQTEADCFKVLQTVAACRGAMNGLFSELVQEHVSQHIIKNSKESKKQDQAALELIELLKSYWK
jgi:DNA-binding FrmR family transcriptional regulator